jgi:dihydrolipoamide dehydrogenase
MEVIIMPKLGFNMDEGKLVEWHKREGESVKAGEPLFSIETDKTVIDVEATSDGVVRKLFINEGDLIPVTLPIAIIAEADEDIEMAEQEALTKLGVSKGDTGEVTTPSTYEQKSSGRDFQVIVVGGGPGGYVAAIRARQLGLRTALVEKDAFGGVCLNRGCIPTKTLLHSAKALRSVQTATKYGVTGLGGSEDAARLDLQSVQMRKEAIRDTLVSGIEVLMKKHGVKVFRGEAVLKDTNTVCVDGLDVSTDNVILATGSVSMELPKDIMTKRDFLTSDTFLELRELPEDIVVIGGGVIGVEFAYFLAIAGSNVHIIESSNRILPPVDAEIVSLVQKDLEKLGVHIYTGAKVTQVTDEAVYFEKESVKSSIETKHVLISVGRAPYVSPDVLTLGVKTDKGAIVTDERMRTNIDNIYAIGDVNGRHMLAHTASAEGIVAAESIAGRDVVMDYSAIPNAIYISPEIASCGLTEDVARESYGDNLRIGIFPMAANGKSCIEGETSGCVKVIATAQYGEILGVHLYCTHATDMIAEIAVAMTAEATTKEVAASVHPHPTISEAVQEAFHAVLEGSIHI